MNPRAPTPCLILGAGLAGLSCALHLQHLALVLEADDVVGGTARSYVRDGFGFDVTGHWLHLREPRMRALVERVAPGLFGVYARRAEVYAFGRRTRYPFQAHTHGLPHEVVAECLLGYFAAREARAKKSLAPPRSFADYVRQCMGEGIARHFMLPYNQKLWTVPADELAHDWCGRFVPLPSPEEVVWGALRPEGSGRAMGYNATFHYPRRGGIGQLAEALAKAAHQPLLLRTRAVAIDVRRRRVGTADGRWFGYRQLVSTLPLPRLLAAAAAVAPLPDAVRRAAAKLRATALTYWDVGLRAPQAEGAAHWTYFPGPEVPFFRVGSPSAVRPDLAPNGGRSYYVEVTHPADEACPVGDEAILRGLREVGLLGAREEPAVFVRRGLGCAYVIMDHAYGAARATVRQWLAPLGIHAVGRFGGWVYDSMEGALLAGEGAAAAVTEALAAGGEQPPASPSYAPRPGFAGVAGIPNLPALR